jgi:hypothetical protein
MISKVRQLLLARPFVPFVVHTDGGNHYRVPTAEHAAIDPRGSRVVVWFDEGGSITVPGLHIAAVEKDAAAKN